jgi:hypothetical protein
MGSGPERAAFVKPQEAGYGVDNVTNGNKWLADIEGFAKSGIPQGIKDIRRQQTQYGISNNIAQGVNEINTTLDGTAAGVNARTGALTRLYGSGNRAIADAENNMALSEADYQRNNFLEGINAYLKLAGLGSNIGGMKNQFALSSAGMQNQYNNEQYKIDSENSFGWDKIFGALIGGGAQVYGSYLGKP